MADRRCWVVTEGHVGLRNQGLGLAEAILDGLSGWEMSLRSVRLRFPWYYVPPGLMRTPFSACTADSDPVAPPWPDLLITCGGRSTGLSVAIKAASGGSVFTVHIQDPRIDPGYFDLVVVPEHDRQRMRAGDNVLFGEAALHRVTPDKIAEAAARMGPRYAHLPRPLVAVLIGGANRRYKLTPARMRAIAAELAELARTHHVGLLVTASRRTGAENEAVLRRALADVPAAIWDGTGENPYFAYLGLADAIVATCDSVSMISEACATGKPVHIIELEGGSRRFHLFHEKLRRDGLIRPFRGVIEDWRYDPPDDTARAAREIRRRMGLD